MTPPGTAKPAPSWSHASATGEEGAGSGSGRGGPPTPTTSFPAFLLQEEGARRESSNSPEELARFRARSGWGKLSTQFSKHKKK